MSNYLTLKVLGAHGDNAGTRHAGSVLIIHNSNSIKAAITRMEGALSKSAHVGSISKPEIAGNG